jgi:hypothetical protein
MAIQLSCILGLDGALVINLSSHWTIQDALSLTSCCCDGTPVDPQERASGTPDFQLRSHWQAALTAKSREMDNLVKVRGTQGMGWGKGGEGWFWVKAPEQEPISQFRGALILST